MRFMPASAASRSIRCPFERKPDRSANRIMSWPQHGAIAPVTRRQPAAASSDLHWGPGDRVTVGRLRRRPNFDMRETACVLGAVAAVSGVNSYCGIGVTLATADEEDQSEQVGLGRLFARWFRGHLDQGISCACSR